MKTANLSLSLLFFSSSTILINKAAHLVNHRYRIINENIIEVIEKYTNLITPLLRKYSRREWRTLNYYHWILSIPHASFSFIYWNSGSKLLVQGLQFRDKRMFWPHTALSKYYSSWKQKKNKVFGHKKNLETIFLAIPGRIYYSTSQ